MYYVNDQRMVVKGKEKDQFNNKAKFMCLELSSINVVVLHVITYNSLLYIDYSLIKVNYTIYLLFFLSIS